MSLNYNLHNTGLGELSPIEKAVVDYVDSYCNHPKPQKSPISYDDLGRFVFDYYKEREPNMIKNFIVGTIAEILTARFNEQSRKEWTDYFTKLLRRRTTKNRTYEEFNPERFNRIMTIFGSARKVPIKRYVINMVENLEMKGLLKRPKTRRKGVTLNN